MIARWIHTAPGLFRGPSPNAVLTEAQDAFVRWANLDEAPTNFADALFSCGYAPQHITPQIWQIALPERTHDH